MKFSLGLPDLFEQKWTMECCSDKPMSMSLSRSLSMMLRLRSPNMISDHFVCPALWHFFHHLPSQKVRFRRKEVQPNWHHIICPKRNTNSTTNIDRTKLRNKRQPQRAFIVSIGFLKILSMFFPLASKKSIAWKTAWPCCAWQIFSKAASKKAWCQRFRSRLVASHPKKQLVGGIPTPLKNIKVKWEYYS